MGARWERGGSEVGVSVLSRTLRVGAAPAAAGCGGETVNRAERCWTLWSLELAAHPSPPRPDAREPTPHTLPTREPHRRVESVVPCLWSISMPACIKTYVGPVGPLTYLPFGRHLGSYSSGKVCQLAA